MTLTCLFLFLFLFLVAEMMLADNVLREAVEVSRLVRGVAVSKEWHWAGN